eukprot:scaffold2207_cov370-Prasinococcus_capsulatus_cf.AAC.3
MSRVFPRPSPGPFLWTGASRACGGAASCGATASPSTPPQRGAASAACGAVRCARARRRSARSLSEGEDGR